MRIGIIGGTGFVGQYLVEALLTVGHRPVLLVRPGSVAKVRRAAECDLVSGSIADSEALRQVLRGCPVGVYLTGLLREFPTRGITFEEAHFNGACRAIDAARAEGTGRMLLMSANGVKPDGTAYQTTKYRAEEYLRATDLEWLILRPSVIYGPPRGQMEFVTQLYRQLIRPSLPAPLFYSGWNPCRAGAFRFSPVHAVDLAQVLVKLLEQPGLWRRIIEIGGPDTVSWKEILRLIAAATGRCKWLVPVPAGPLKLLARWPGFPISRDQLEMLLAGNTCPADEPWRSCGISPRRFSITELAYLNENQPAR
ncbi:MAG: NAD(P)H-binding protein [Candidatus Neomarinimicrobiota bacterium]